MVPSYQSYAGTQVYAFECDTYQKESVKMGENKRCISDERLSATGFSYTLSLISGK